MLDTSRTEALLGLENVRTLSRTHIAVFGLGGVGSFAVEAFVRAGVGTLSLYDGDILTASNCNRQLYALSSTMGRPKTDVAAERARDIHPGMDIRPYNMTICADTIDQIDFSAFTYCLDAIDDVRAKLLLITRAHNAKTPILSCMGAGNKLDPTRFQIAPIHQTEVCPLCRIMRRELKNLHLSDTMVIYSREKPHTAPYTDPVSGKRCPGSVSFVPSVMGLQAAGYILQQIINPTLCVGQTADPLIG